MTTPDGPVYEPTAPSSRPGSPLQPSLDGRRFAAAADVRGGEVSTETIFSYRQRGATISAVYQGGDIRLGYLVGTRDGDELDFRYVHVNSRGATASGHCHSRIEVLNDGRLRLHEKWSWESRPGDGTSIVEEIGDDLASGVAREHH